jgi:hypothetical protein
MGQTDFGLVRRGSRYGAGQVTESRLITLTPASMPFWASLNKQTAVSRDSCASCSAAA